MLDGKDFIEFDIFPDEEWLAEYENLISVHHVSNDDSEVDFQIFGMDFSMKKEEVNNLIICLRGKLEMK